MKAASYGIIPTSVSTGHWTESVRQSYQKRTGSGWASSIRKSGIEFTHKLV